MGKSEEYLAKKRNKAARKRLRGTVDFTRGIQAAKRRRKAGRRRVCEGMCYTLPTLEDPFNDLFEERILKKKVKKEQEDEDINVSTHLHGHSKINVPEKDRQSREGGKVTKSHKPAKSANKGRNLVTSVSRDDSDPQGLGKMNHGQKRESNICNGRMGGLEKVIWTPEVEMCSIVSDQWMSSTEDAFGQAICVLTNVKMLSGSQNAYHDKITSTKEKRKLFASEWHWSLWEACGSGCDVFAIGSTTDPYTAAACVLAGVTHIAGRRKSSGMTSSNSCVLYIVKTKEYALKVRNIFKILKPLLGVHAVSLHPGTSLEHQIEGLSGTSPEVLIATPDRLYDLLNVNAVSLTNVSFMIVDGVTEIVSSEMGYQLEKINTELGRNVQTVTLCATISKAVSNVCQKLLKDPIRRVLSADVDILHHSALITQNVEVLLSEEKKLQKMHKIIKLHLNSKQPHGGILVLFRSQVILQVKDAIQQDGYLIECLMEGDGETNQSNESIVDKFRNGQVAVLLCTENQVNHIDIAAVGMVILYEFPVTIERYFELLTKMSRHTKDGILYSFCSGSTAPLASSLVDVLEKCLQPVPSSLLMLLEAAKVVDKQKT